MAHRCEPYCCLMSSSSITTAAGGAAVHCAHGWNQPPTRNARKAKAGSPIACTECQCRCQLPGHWVHMLLQVLKVGPIPRHMQPPWH
jgi:hypothetical protein